MITRYLVATAASWCLLCSPASAQSFAPGVPSSVRTEVGKAVGVKRDTDLSIEMLASPHLTTSQSLRVVEVAQDHSSEGVRVKLQCSPAINCLPFYVLVRGISLPSSERLSPEPMVLADVIVRAGSTGWLQQTSGANLKITVPVTALQAGRAGEVIRVRMGNRKVWRARVISSGIFHAVGDQR